MKKINLFLVTVLVAISIFFPGDIFNFKKCFFILLFVLNIKLLVNNKISIVFWGIYFPIVLLLYSTLLNGDILSSFTRGYVMFMVLLLPIIKKYQIDYEKILINSIIVLAAFVGLLAIMDIMGIMDINSGIITRFIYDKDIGYVGASVFYPFYYKIFLKTTPLIVLLLFHSLKGKNIFLFVLSAIGLLLSGTRANVVFPIILIIFLVIKVSIKDLFQKRRVPRAVLVLSLALIFIIFSKGVMYNSVKEIMTLENSQKSDSVRIGHFDSYKELVRENPVILFTGTGLGSMFFSKGTGEFQSSVELSYLDLLRQMGLVFFVIFMLFVLYPILALNKKWICQKYAYITYLLIAATNPLLFSSTAYLVYVYIYLKVGCKEKPKKNTNRVVKSKRGECNAIAY
jgi:hypothetical protein